MSGAEETTLWVRAFVDELARAGVREVVLAPGSRSTPLVMACAADGRFRLRVHLDERSAAFFALGVGKATGRPAVVITTSGTATANVLPAVIEAARGETPLLVLTADRPHHLRDSDANQAIDQTRLYGPFVRAFHEVAPPTSSAPALRHLRALAARAVASAMGAPAGPVHLNFPFAKPLEPVEGVAEAGGEDPVAIEGRTEGRPYTRVEPGRREPSPEALEMLADELRVGRGVIVAGPSPDSGRLGEAVCRLAAATGYPLLADPLSGARFGPHGGSEVVSGYDLFLRDSELRAALAPELILRVGASPTSASLQGWMGAQEGVRHIVIDGGGRWKDHGSLATDYIEADAAGTLLTLADLVERSVDPDWAARWSTAGDAAREAVEGMMASAGSAEDGARECDLLATLAGVLPAGARLFVSNSMPVRDLDAFGLPREEPLEVYANRGASGIDGIVSTAFGVAAAGDGPVVCVLGDIAFFHDQNGLLWSREPDTPVVFVLIDNDGGGIFQMLPIAGREPAFTDFFTTPHGLDFAHAARLHDVPLEEPTPEALGPALADALEAGRTRLLRVRTDRARGHARRLEIAEAVAESVRTALE
jgi:2-succinyl-5-enolpyruvyl-6-hydroxy-3-cyclohexene-1-carboxylate synthase